MTIGFLKKFRIGRGQVRFQFYWVPCMILDKRVIDVERIDANLRKFTVKEEQVQVQVDGKKKRWVEASYVKYDTE